MNKKYFGFIAACSDNCSSNIDKTDSTNIKTKTIISDYRK
jgi:hypothetical protein